MDVFQKTYIARTHTGNTKGQLKLINKPFGKKARYSSMEGAQAQAAPHGSI